MTNKRVIVSGSLAFDRIMSFHDQFKNHILPEKIHILNVSFTVNNLQESFGGTAGNIAFNLHLLKMPSLIIGSAGHDFGRYKQWLDQQEHVETSYITIIPDHFTASATIITDQDDNQITGFHRGAMDMPATIPEEIIKKTACFGIVSPGNIEEMKKITDLYKRYHIPYMFDPGQTIPAMTKEQLTNGITGSEILISNDYELELIKQKMESSTNQILKKTHILITTLGSSGSMITQKNGQSIRIPAFPVRRVIDPTGAGDAYRAGFIFGYRQQQSLLECGLVGACAASFAIEKKGCQEHRYQISEFEQRLKKQKLSFNYETTPHQK